MKILIALFFTILLYGVARADMVPLDTTTVIHYSNKDIEIVHPQYDTILATETAYYHYQVVMTSFAIPYTLNYSTTVYYETQWVEYHQKVPYSFFWWPNTDNSDFIYGRREDGQLSWKPKGMLIGGQ